MENIIKEIENKINKLQDDIKKLNNIDSLSKVKRLELIKNTPLRGRSKASLDILLQDIPFKNHETVRTKDANHYNIFLDDYIIKIPTYNSKDIVVQYSYEAENKILNDVSCLRRRWEENIIVKNVLVADKENLIKKSKSIFHIFNLKNIELSLTKFENSISLIENEIISSKFLYHEAMKNVNNKEKLFIDLLKIELKDYLDNSYKLNTMHLMNYNVDFLDAKCVTADTIKDSIITK